jgi:hypothetical protein
MSAREGDDVATGQVTVEAMMYRIQVHVEARPYQKKVEAVCQRSSVMQDDWFMLFQVIWHCEK